MILLIDDTRSFKVSRGEVIARTSKEAILILGSNPHFEEVWFDCILAGSDEITPVLSFLLKAHKNGTAPLIERAIIQTSSPEGAQLIRAYLERMKVQTIVRVDAEDYLNN